ncbi:MAG: NfeD family protein [Pseudonocardia sp.]|nr:NfeD family protein [Pseudonocardia sp.]
MVPVIWLVAGIALIIGEVLSGEFVVLMLGGGALVAAGGAAAFGLGWILSAVLFAVASTLLIAGVRPLLRRRLDRGIERYVGHTEQIVGGPATVVERVDGSGGRVKIAGSLWSAKAFDGEQVMEPGDEVTVIEISGATALVLAQ